ncbi:MAG TPA: hypothetical protein ENL04_01300 [Sulfuricurvum sp.]|nr:hypothetical protein [Sulfuricurvum sp.]
MKKLLGMIVSVVLMIGTGAAAAESKGGVNAYNYTEYADSATVKKNLEAQGFEVLASYAPTKQSETLVITCPGLKKAASKPDRGFAAVMRVLVDGEHKRIAYTNPLYFAKAFLQDDYDDAIAKKAAGKLAAALGEGTPSADKVDDDDLADYRFMLGMPHYEDMEELAEGDNAALLKKLEAYNGGKNVVFTLDLGKSTLVGFDLSDETKKFVEKIGTQNAEVLPYMMLIEDGKAKTLAAKYYLAISYPLLSMGEFMTIASVPGDILDELELPFN